MVLSFDRVLGFNDSLSRLAAVCSGRKVDCRAVWRWRLPWLSVPVVATGQRAVDQAAQQLAAASRRAEAIVGMAGSTDSAAVAGCTPNHSVAGSTAVDVKRKPIAMTLLCAASPTSSITTPASTSVPRTTTAGGMTRIVRCFNDWESRFGGVAPGKNQQSLPWQWGCCYL
ncbi:hypothetical protein Ccrd_001170 [Cynara cardunculus var. scolymus]|uniref:Uncharacterized protein n=1 Tax=Cynara cardunculus var. scolymus TaxID=59895 RepID=A0A103XTU0_CYNCS|nr:hypothetical protein Ccrd_001170 [Cynara cardunculus var. scolymus]